MFLGYLRQSTAATVRTPQFVGTDGTTEQAALSSQSGRITKNGTAAAFTPASWAHDANGYYLLGLSTSHTDTVGRATIQFSSSGTYLSVPLEFHVISAAVYDVLFGATAPSTYAGGDTAGTTTLLARVGSALTISGGKVAATLAAADVSGNLPADLQTIKTQAVTCSAGVTVNPNVGTTTAALAVDASGRVDVGKILGTASAGAAGYVGLDWGHVTAPTTTVNLSGTTISTAQAVASVSGAVGSVTGDVGGKVLGGGASSIAGVGANANVTQVNGSTATTTTGVILASGTANSGGSSTGFTATIAGSTLSGTSGAYDGMKVLFQSGGLATEVGTVNTYTVSSGTATFTFVSGQAFTAAPGAGDTFIVG